MSSFKDYERVIDLSHVLNSKTQTFPAPWHRNVEFTALGTMETVGRNTTQIHIGTHSGTHIDAPSHFLRDGKTVDQLILSRFVGEFDYINLRKSNPREAITLEVLKSAYPEPTTKRIIILDYGWSPQFGRPHYYADQPYLSYEASNYLLSLEPKMVGYDVAMPDNPLEGYGNDCDSPVHKLFLSEGIPLLENLRIDKPIEHLKMLVVVGG